MSTQQFDARRSLSRRRLLVLTGVALGTGGLLAACQAAAPAAPPASAPATAAPGTTGASPLKGTKLTIIGGNSYVNVHSQVNPGGEIRGQLTLKP